MVRPPPETEEMPEDEEIPEVDDEPEKVPPPEDEPPPADELPLRLDGRWTDGAVRCANFAPMKAAAAAATRPTRKVSLRTRRRPSSRACRAAAAWREEP